MGFKARVDSLACTFQHLCTTNSSDSPLVQNLLELLAASRIKHTAVSVYPQGEGVSASVHSGISPSPKSRHPFPPGADTPPGSRHTPSGADTPQADTPHGSWHPPPQEQTPHWEQTPPPEQTTPGADTPPPEQTPPQSRHPREQTHPQTPPSPEQTPPRSRHPPPQEQTHPPPRETATTASYWNAFLLHYCSSNALKYAVSEPRLHR